MPLRWDSDKLKGLRARVHAIASGEFRRKLYTQLAAEADHLVKLGFRKSEDPYGVPWKGAMRKGKLLTQGQILRDTGRLQNSFSARATDTGFTIGSDVKYAPIHNYGGTITQPARVNAHRKNGRYARRSQLAARASGAVRVSFSAAHSFRMPQRRMIPDPGNLGPIWRKALGEEFRRLLQLQILKGVV